MSRSCQEQQLSGGGALAFFPTSGMFGISAEGNPLLFGTWPLWGYTVAQKFYNSIFWKSKRQP